MESMICMLPKFYELNKSTYQGVKILFLIKWLSTTPARILIKSVVFTTISHLLEN